MPGQDAHAAAADTPDEVLTPEETARVMRTTTRTLRRYDAEGIGLPRVKLGKRRVGYWRSDVEAWLRSRTTPTKRQHAA